MDTISCGACRAASSRVVGRLNPNAWVGAPTTSSSVSAREVAVPTSTRSTSMNGTIPSPTARATSRVLPNIDS
ncbi:hypothetical protein [Cellulomonas sp. ATA003]|uniref:hypothetical protein n=1 Tax=Cellulomonas sp. ATA003 TaxID=3073064 RepID=UPI002873D3FD|nr:hypothetical protein [Cellulomonas sp. ATA003]WNB86954.1 hypothetical protein REH70_07325 [Cellulomonas sp. ATA003]